MHCVLTRQLREGEQRAQQAVQPTEVDRAVSVDAAVRSGRGHRMAGSSAPSEAIRSGRKKRFVGAPVSAI